MKKLAINGFGRIGRICYKILKNYKNVKLVAINDGNPIENLINLIKYDSTYGPSTQKDEIFLYEKDGLKFLKTHNSDILCLNDRNPANLPWLDLKVDVVLECTGKLLYEEDLRKHKLAGAKKVILSAPSKSDIKTIILGVNDNILTKDDDIISASSCTTNCLAPLLKIVSDNFEILKVFFSTIHAYTSDQNLLDAAHKDPRRARSAIRSIIPTTTGAAKNIDKIFPFLSGKIKGSSLRVPVENGSLLELVIELEKKTSYKEVNELFKLAANSNLKKILEYNEDPIVSTDIIGNSHSAVFDSTLTETNGNLIKINAWYDNEFAYASRMCELALMI